MLQLRRYHLTVTVHHMMSVYFWFNFLFLIFLMFDDLMSLVSSDQHTTAQKSSVYYHTSQIKATNLNNWESENQAYL